MSESQSIGENVQETPNQSPLQTGSSEAPGAQVNFNLQLNQLSLPGDYVGAMQVAALLPEPMQERAMKMAEKEQMYRHEEGKKAGQRQHELDLKKVESDYELLKQKQSCTFSSEMWGKIFGFIVLGGFFGGILYTCITCNFTGLGLLLGASAVLGILVKCFVVLMMQNKNS